MNMPTGYAVVCHRGSVKQAEMIADGLAVSELRHLDNVIMDTMK